ncbi:extracellular solute-binding protein [Roseococcus pinisoli]|uniref:Extracellular solute-binding protein n=1 Tax=Roseococcus pinisoli TaxID=2835040 RepID=A0ABS5QCL8_9PROT|nr:extracellular solute-binding protein [Roseococcus pinisoli]MBS7811437.1 extracellular solute-binding protein [Roseococcus pinisoli]
MQRRVILAATAAGLFAPAVLRAQERVVSLYSARHYDADKLVNEAFTRATGIRVRVIEANADQLLERIRAEGANSPADVFMTVDASRLSRAVELGLTQPHGVPVIDSRVPASLREPGGHWFSVSRRARVLMYDKAKGPPAGLARYEDLSNDRYKGQIAVRSSGNGYNVALAASFLAANGAEATEAWARGIAANLARPPAGGDRDQIRAIMAGQGTIAISNTYYLGLMSVSPQADVREMAERVGVIFPNQAAGDRGTHVNISGAAMIKTSPNTAEARAFLEFLTGAEAQKTFGLVNMEYPVVPDSDVPPFLTALGDFRQEAPDGPKMLANAPEALRLMQRAGWR